MTTPLLIVAAGGTGGHMFPAQALTEAMLARGWRVTLLSDSRGLRYAEGFPAEVERVEVAAASPGRGGLTGLLALPVTLVRGMIGSARLLRADRPAAIAGFGGYPTFPPLAAATAMGVPILLHEQNAVLGAVNRRFARHAAVVACGVWPVTNRPGRATLEHLGNPVRRAVRDMAEAAYVPPAKDGPVRLLVFGGSQGASVLAEVVPAALGRLPEALRVRLEVVHQTRAADRDDALAAYAKAGVGEPETAEFFADMPARMAAAHLVIARAGASTVAEIACIGRPAILVPYPHAKADHQTANAAALASAGAAVAIQQPELTPERLASEIEACLAPARAAEMAAAARQAGRPDAAERLADKIEAIAGACHAADRGGSATPATRGSDFAGRQ